MTLVYLSTAWLMGISLAQWATHWFYPPLVLIGLLAILPPLAGFPCGRMTPAFDGSPPGASFSYSVRYATRSPCVTSLCLITQLFT